MKAILLRAFLFVLAAAAVGCSDRDDGGSAKTGPDVVTRLHQAVLKGDLPLVQSLIAGGCDVDARDKDGYTPLCTATGRGQADIVRFLISKGADVNARPATSASILSFAAWHGRADIARLFLDAGADVNAGKERGGTALYEAGQLRRDGEGHEDVVKLLLDRGAEILPGDTRENETLLYFAVQCGMHDLIGKVLVAGASPNTVSGFTGTSVLGEAVARGDAEAARLLISRGADVNLEDELHRVPLQYARRWSKDAVTVLLDKGADVKTKFLLHWAVDSDEKEVLELFLTHGADVNQKDPAGRTPLDEAVSQLGRDQIVELLKKHGGIQGRAGD
jgi:ankyrin repeat protein